MRNPQSPSPRRRSLHRWRRSSALTLAALTSLTFLSACGGDGKSGGSGSSIGHIAARGLAAATVAPTQAEASRFLTQATFGATDADLASVQSLGYSTWIDNQEAMAPSGLHLTWMDNRNAVIQAATPGAALSSNQFYESFWMQAATGPDQLRQRVKLALSQMFVVSFRNTQENARGMAHFYDILGKDAFGNFRDLLNDVTYSPAMAIYLTYMSNVNDDPKTGRLPDQNYARELMQLMTLGVYKLNVDGTLNKDIFGNPQPTYTTADIVGLSKVFTGLAWYNVNPEVHSFYGNYKDVEAYTKPLIAYNAYHSTSEKDFLGTTIPASTTADANADVKVALDTIFNNPNVGPFISRQLIQHLVTSNPTPAYVGRVAAVFNDNGSGVRGDMKAVIKAILMDSEARGASTDPDYGKLRDPVVCLGNWMRSFGATSLTGNWLTNWPTANYMLGDAPMTSPSVFNYFRPGYVPPHTTLGSKGYEAPEFQITDEVSTATYINTMQTALNVGVGLSVPGNTTSLDINSAYTNEMAVAADPAALTDRVNMLLGAQMSAGLRTRIINALTTITIPGPTYTQSAINFAKLNRVRAAILLTMASPEYLAQR